MMPVTASNKRITPGMCGWFSGGSDASTAPSWDRCACGALTLLYRTLDRKTSPIEPGLRLLILVRVSQINGRLFCMDLNSPTAVERHVSGEKLAAEDDSLLENTRKHFPDDAFIELTALIAFQNISSKFNAALQVLAQGFCSMKDTYLR